jgi:hypothetical protein
LHRPLVHTFEQSLLLVQQKSFYQPFPLHLAPGKQAVEVAVGDEVLVVVFLVTPE